MKSTLNSLLITAAGFALSAAAAYGQTQLRANVPFEFKTASGVQPAGQYRVAPASSDGSVMKVENVATGHTGLTGIGSNSGSSKDGSAKLVFRCGSEGGCSLAEIKMGDGRGWSYKTPKLKPSEQERVAVVYFDSRLAE